MSEKNNLTSEEKNKLDTLFKKARKADQKQSVNISDAETKAAYQKLKISENDPKEPLFPIKPYFKYAAAAVLLIALIGLGLLLTPYSIEVPNGEKETVTLSGGTTITLNSGSSLSWPRWFSFGERTVSLDGEAFFDVAKNGSPFHVETQNARVTVMGTSFNVRAWSGENQNKTSIFLLEGKVAFAPKTGRENAVILKSGEMSSLSGAQAIPAQPKEVDPSKATAWMQDGLAFDNQPLSAIFAEISRRFDVKIRMKNKRLLDETLTIYISEMKSAEQTLADICKVKNLKYAKKDDIFIVSRS